MRAPRPRRVLVLLALLAPLLPAAALPLSELTGTTDFRWFPSDVVRLPGGAVLLTAASTYPLRELALHPSVSTAPSPPPFGETFLAARVHPDNASVVWAAAFSAFENAVAAAADPAGNAYLAGPPRPDPAAAAAAPSDPVRLVKLSPTGAVVWTRTARDPGQNLTLPPNMYVEVERGRLLFHAADVLLLPGVRRRRSGTDAFVLRVSAGTGALVRRTRLPRPPGGPAPPFRFAAGGGPRPAACMLRLQEQDDAFAGPRLHAQCQRLNGGRIASRRLSPLEDGLALFSAAAAVADADDDADDARPVLHVAYARAWGFDPAAAEGQSQATHQLVVRRLTAAQLDDATPEVVVRVGTPRFSEPGVTVERVAYVPGADAVAVLVFTTVRWEGFEPGSGAADLQARVESDRYVFPPDRWVLFFGGSGRFAAQRIRRDPRRPRVEDEWNAMLVTGMEVAEGARSLYLSGMLQTLRGGNDIKSGPFYVHEMKVPRRDLVGPKPREEDEEEAGEETAEPSVEASAEPSMEVSAEPSMEASAEPSMGPSGEAAEEPGEDGWWEWPPTWWAQPPDPTPPPV